MSGLIGGRVDSARGDRGGRRSAAPCPASSGPGGRGEATCAGVARGRRVTTPSGGVAAGDLTWVGRSERSRGRVLMPGCVPSRRVPCGQELTMGPCGFRSGPGAARYGGRTATKSEARRCVPLTYARTGARLRIISAIPEGSGKRGEAHLNMAYLRKCRAHVGPFLSMVPGSPLMPRESHEYADITTASAGSSGVRELACTRPGRARVVPPLGLVSGATPDGEGAGGLDLAPVPGPVPRWPPTCWLWSPSTRALFADPVRRCRAYQRGGPPRGLGERIRPAEALVPGPADRRPLEP